MIPMLTNPAKEHLKALRLPGMLEAYTRQLELPESASLTFEKRFSLIVDYGCSRRRTKKINGLIKKPEFHQEALPEDILTTARIEQGLNDVITGPIGVDKSHIATALGYMACRREQVVHYYKASELVDELTAAK